MATPKGPAQPARPTGAGSGLVLSLSAPEAVQRMVLTTRTNDNISAWDPKQYALYGANDELAWDSTAWTAVASGATNLPDGKGQSSTLNFDNSVAYKYYKLVFTETTGSYNNQRYVHVSEVALYAPAVVVEQGDVLRLSGNLKAIAALDRPLDFQPIAKKIRGSNRKNNAKFAMRRKN